MRCDCPEDGQVVAAVGQVGGHGRYQGAEPAVYRRDATRGQVPGADLGQPLGCDVTTGCDPGEEGLDVVGALRPAEGYEQDGVVSGGHGRCHDRWISR